MKARFSTTPMLSSSSAFVATLGDRMKGSAKSEARMITAKIRNTSCQLKDCKRNSAIGAPITCPADPAAVAMPSAIDRFSALAARPTMASTTPNPVPAMPNPTRISSICICPGVTAQPESTSPAAYISAPATMAFLSPNRSATAPNSGCPIPQARFWMAIASENSARAQPNSSAIGIWNTPKLARMAKPSISTTHPAIRTGVIRGALRVIGNLDLWRIFSAPPPARSNADL